MKFIWGRLHFLTKIGTIFLLIGIIPFLTVIVLDAIGIVKAGNLVLGTGPLVGITFYPSLIIIILVFTATTKKRNKKNHTKRFVETHHTMRPKASTRPILNVIVCGK